MQERGGDGGLFSGFTTLNEKQSRYLSNCEIVFTIASKAAFSLTATETVTLRSPASGRSRMANWLSRRLEGI